MIETSPGHTYTATVEDAPEGLEGTIGIRVEDADANVITARTTAGIAELAPGVYAIDDLVAPGSTGTYIVIWDTGDVPLEPEDIATEELLVRLAIPLAGVGPLTVARLITRPCVIIRRLAGTTKNSYGAEIPNEEEVETFWNVQQRQRSEPGDQGEVSSSLWNAYFLAGTEFTTADEVWDEDLGLFEVVGAPWPVRNSLTQRDSHVESTVKRVAGADES